MWDGRIMVVSANFGAKRSVCEYRIYERGSEIASGRSEKQSFQLQDIEDLLANVRLKGIDVADLDAIGIAVPGITGQICLVISSGAAVAVAMVLLMLPAALATLDRVIVKRKAEQQ